MSRTIEEIDDDIAKAQRRAARVEAEVQVAAREYKGGLTTLKELGIEVKDKNNIDLSDKIEQFEQEAAKHLEEAATATEEATTLLTQLEDAVNVARA